MDLVILAGSLGHEAPWTHGRPRAFLRLPQGTLIESLISRFDTPFAGSCVICANGNTSRFVDHLRGIRTGHLELSFFEDSIPLGTAGCLKACESRVQADTIILSGGAVWLNDEPEWMVDEHRRQGNALTVFCTRDSGWMGSGLRNHLRPAGIYCCERSVLEFIRPTGFQDLKEQLVPALHQAGLRVGAVPLKGESREISDRSSYLRLIAHLLSNQRLPQGEYERIAPDIWCGRDVKIASNARIVGPALIGHGCRIEDGSVIVGPTVLGEECRIGSNAWLIRVVAPRGLRVPSGVSLTDRVLPGAVPSIVDLSRSTRFPVGQAEEVSIAQAGPAHVARNSTPSHRGANVWKKAVTGAVLATAFVWAFWPSLAELWTQLTRNADFSAGQLVPAAATYMIMTRRSRLSGLSAGFWWFGAAVFAVGLAFNLSGRYFRYSSAENVGVVTCALGVFASIAGYEITRRLWFPLLFLFLLVPLPHSVHGAVMLPLQGMSAQVATTVLETVGIPSVRSGHVLEVAGQQIAVAEACSGLRMALAFIIVTGVLAYVSEKPRWQKVTVLISSVPIALACNVVRIVFSAYLFSIGCEWLAQGAFHDGAGLIMMPVAVGLVLVEFWLLSNLVVPQSAVAAIVEVCDDRVQRRPVVSSSRA